MFVGSPYILWRTNMKQLIHPGQWSWRYILQFYRASPCINLANIVHTIFLHKLVKLYWFAGQEETTPGTRVEKNRVTEIHYPKEFRNENRKITAQSLGANSAALIAVHRSSSSHAVKRSSSTVLLDASKGFECAQQQQQQQQNDLNQHRLQSSTHQSDLQPSHQQ